MLLESEFTEFRSEDYPRHNQKASVVGIHKKHKFMTIMIQEMKAFDSKKLKKKA
jgi:hypothetical protein